MGSFMEKFYHEGYEEELVASLKRKPTEYTIALMFRIIADKKNPIGLQYPPNLAKALRQIGPEIDGFKGCDRIKPVICENHIRYAALHDSASTLCDGCLIDLF